MNNPEIWTIKMADHPQDDFVRLSAYKALDLQMAELMVENARLKAEVEEVVDDNIRLTQDNGGLRGENARLKAEVERLRKAGDELALSLAVFHLLHRGKIDTTTQPDIVAWNAAKEGKQP